MKSSKFSHAFLIISIFIYNYFFWRESFGLNMFLFSVMLITFQLILNPGSIRSRLVQITVAGTLVTALAVLFFNSGFSKVAHILSFLVMSGFIHESRLRSVFYAIMQTISGYFKVPLLLRLEVCESEERSVHVKRGYRFLQLAFFPLIVTAVFYLIFLGANPVFEELSSTMWQNIFDFFNRFFELVSFTRLLFLLFGLLLISGFLYNTNIRGYLSRELEKSDLLKRVRRRFAPQLGVYVSADPDPGFPLIALKNENRKGVLLIVMVNIVLLVVNVIDISWVWFGFHAPAHFNMKQFVHEGTYLLILSILLSIGILLYYFRNNQNFYSRNKLLIGLACLWIFQNMILCISVGMRNYHYINYHGLAYRRLGVIMFLVLTFFGLITMYIKIRKTRSFYYLLRVNTWALYAVMCAATLCNWDVLIAKFNLNHWNVSQIDVDFYLMLSDKALPVIYENLPKVQEQIEKHRNNQEIWITHLSMTSFMADLDRKKNKFLMHEKVHTWCSWNLPDHKTSEFLHDKMLAQQEKIKTEDDQISSVPFTSEDEFPTAD